MKRKTGRDSRPLYDREGIYQRHSYDAEKREAWRLIGARLELLARGDDNVATLKRRGKAA